MRTLITGDAAGLERADSIILPGVGAFPDAAERLRGAGLDRVLAEQSEKSPSWASAWGCSFSSTWAEEGRTCKGLGLVHGRVHRIDTEYKLPHIGWNSLTFQNGAPIFRGLEDRAYVYFVHSFCGVAADREERDCPDGLRRVRGGGGAQRQCVRLPVPPGEERGAGSADIKEFWGS